MVTIFNQDSLLLSKLISLTITCLLVALMIPTTTVYSRDFTMKKKVDGFTIDIAINRNPPIVAKNELRVTVTDPQGKALTNLKVMVNYYMPPMPGMAPMNYTVQASPKGSAYGVIMDLIMTGPWFIVVKTEVSGKRLTASFPIDVR